MFTVSLSEKKGVQMNSAHKHSHDNASKNIGIAFFLNLFFAIIELFGGLYTNSIAIISDAVHDFGDCISLGISWFLQKKSNKKSDAKYSYGYKRYSLLGAIIISIVLIISAVFILRESIERIISPQEANAKGMMVLAIFGIIVNGFAVLRLRKGKSLNEKAVFLHLMEDVLGWIAIFIVSIVMLFVNIPILDPLLSIGITIWVLSNVYKNLKNTFKVLLQEIPQNINVESLKTEILQINGVKSFHDFHLWSLDGERNIMSLHIVTDNETPESQLLNIKKQIREVSHKFNIQHTTTEVESEQEMTNCDFADGCD